MNGYQRIMNTLAGEPVDRTGVWPFIMLFSAKYAQVPYGKFASDYRELVKAQIRTVEDFDLDVVPIDSDAYREASAMGAKIVFPENNLPKMQSFAIPEKTKFSFSMPIIENCPRLVDKIEGVRLAKQHFGNEKAVLGWIEAPFQCAGTFYEMDEFMMDLYEEPEFINDLLEFTTQLGVKFATAQVQAGADIIGIGDAMASLVSPRIYQDYIFPYTKMLVQQLKATTNAKLKYHICGKSIHLLPYIKDLGFDVINIDSKVDIVDAAACLGEQICIKGNLSPVEVLLQSDAKKVYEDAYRLTRLGIKKFILSPGCEVPVNTPHENLKALVDAAKAF